MNVNTHAHTNLIKRKRKSTNGNTSRKSTKERKVKKKKKTKTRMRSKTKRAKKVKVLSLKENHEDIRIRTLFTSTLKGSKLSSKTNMATFASSRGSTNAPNSFRISETTAFWSSTPNPTPFFSPTMLTLINSSLSLTVSIPFLSK